MKDMGGVNSLERLKDRCRVDDLTGCWNWSLRIGNAGLPSVHARMPWAPDVKVSTTGMRCAYMFKTGKTLPNGWFVWAKCNNSMCVNPDHAVAGTGKELGMAMEKRGIYKNKPAKLRACRENASKTRKLTMEQAREIRSSQERAVELAKYYGINKTTIWAIRRGERYRETGLRNSSVFTMGLP